MNYRHLLQQLEKARNQLLLDGIHHQAKCLIIIIMKYFIKCQVTNNSIISSIIDEIGNWKRRMKLLMDLKAKLIYCFIVLLFICFLVAKDVRSQ